MSCKRSVYAKLKQKNKFFAIILVMYLLIPIFAGMYYLKNDSAGRRLLIWKGSILSIAKHPVGVGLGHFPNAYGVAQALYPYLNDQISFLFEYGRNLSQAEQPEKSNEF